MMMTSVSNRMALAAASSASRDVLPPKPRDAIHNATGARANKASQKACAGATCPSQHATAGMRTPKVASHQVTATAEAGASSGATKTLFSHWGCRHDRRLTRTAITIPSTGALDDRSLDCTSWQGGAVTTTVKVTNLFNQTVQQQHIFGDLLRRTVVGDVTFTL